MTSENNGQAIRPERTLTVGNITWTVFEHGVTYDQPRGDSLIFDSQQVVRRVRHYPDNWIELDDGALIALCDRVKGA